MRFLGFFIGCVIVAGQSLAMDRAEALFSAVASGDEDAVARLIRANAPINSRNADKRTPLHIAAGDLSDHDGLPIVNLLLAAGASTRIYDKFCYSASQLAYLAHNWFISARIDYAQERERARDSEPIPALSMLCCRVIADSGFNWRVHSVSVPVRDMLEAYAWLPCEQQGAAGSKRVRKGGLDCIDGLQKKTCR